MPRPPPTPRLKASLPMRPAHAPFPGGVTARVPRQRIPHLRRGPVPRILRSAFRVEARCPAFQGEDPRPVSRPTPARGSDSSWSTPASNARTPDGGWPLPSSTSSAPPATRPYAPPSSTTTRRFWPSGPPSATNSSTTARTPNGRLLCRPPQAAVRRLARGGPMPRARARTARPLSGPPHAPAGRPPGGSSRRYGEPSHNAPLWGRGPVGCRPVGCGFVGCGPGGHSGPLSVMTWSRASGVGAPRDVVPWEVVP